MLYVWESEMLRDWAPGTIAVSADSMEDAYNKALNYLETYLRDRYDYLFSYEDEDTIEQLKELRDIFLKDVSIEPQIMDVLFVQGSS